MKKNALILIFTLCTLAIFGQQDSVPAQDVQDTIVPSYSRNYEYSKKYRSRRNTKTRFGLIDFGTSGMATPETYRLENGIDPFELRPWKSTNINLHFVQQRVSLAGGYFNLVYGLTWEMHRAFFDNPVVLLPDTPEATFEFIPDANFKKNRLSYSYLTVPLMFNIKSNPRYSYRSLHISAGVYAGVLLGANFKTKEKGNKEKTRDNFGLNTWRYGLRAELGYGPVILYGTMALNDLFDEDKDGGYEVTPFSVGLVLWPF